MKHQLLILLLFCSTSLLSQQNQNRQFHHWKNLLLVTKSYGINSEAVKIHTYSNKNRKNLQMSGFFHGHWVLNSLK
jgi:hypothetical protein